MPAKADFGRFGIDSRPHLGILLAVLGGLYFDAFYVEF